MYLSVIFHINSNKPFIPYLQKTILNLTTNNKLVLITHHSLSNPSLKSLHSKFTNNP